MCITFQMPLVQAAVVVTMVPTAGDLAGVVNISMIFLWWLIPHVYYLYRQQWWSLRFPWQGIWWRSWTLLWYISNDLFHMFITCTGSSGGHYGSHCRGFGGGREHFYDISMMTYSTCLLPKQAAVVVTMVPTAGDLAAVVNISMIFLWRLILHVDYLYRQQWWSLWFPHQGIWRRSWIFLWLLIPHVYYLYRQQWWSLWIPWQGIWLRSWILLWYFYDDLFHMFIICTGSSGGHYGSHGRVFGGGREYFYDISLTTYSICLLPIQVAVVVTMVPW